MTDKTLETLKALRDAMKATQQKMDAGLTINALHGNKIASLDEAIKRLEGQSKEQIETAIQNAWNDLHPKNGGLTSYKELLDAAVDAVVAVMK